MSSSVSTTNLSDSDVSWMETSASELIWEPTELNSPCKRFSLNFHQTLSPSLDHRTGFLPKLGRNFSASKMPTSSTVPPTAAAVKNRSPTASDSEEYEYEEIEIEEEIEVEEEVSDDEEEEVSDDEEEEFEEVEVEVEVEVEEEVEEEVEVEDDEEREQEKEKGSGEDVPRSIEDLDDVKRFLPKLGRNFSASKMPTSSAVPPTAAAVKDRSPTASGSEEYEYEEIEIEEEIEVEEEVSDDEEEDFEEVEVEVEEEIEEEVEDDEEREQEKEKGSGEDVPRSIEDLDDVKRKEKIISDGEKTSQRDGGIMAAETTNPINESSKQVTVGDSVDDSDKVPCSEEQTTQMNTKDVNDAHVKEPRLDVDIPLIKPRSLSPAMEINEGNKRPALVCDFFAKGWCIKGTSCRFRHIKDPPINVVDQQNEPQKSQPQDEGVKEGTERSNPATSGTAPTLKACSSEFKPGSQKDNPNRVTNPPVNESLSNSFMGPNYNKSNWASNAPKMEEFGGKGYRFGLHNHNYNSSYHGMVWPRASTSLSSSSWKSDSKISGYDWEPSKPFRSRFLISQGIPIPDIQYDPIHIQYDPIRDSIEQPTPTKIGDKLSKLSSSSRVPSISGTHSPLQEKLKTDNGSDKFSIGSHVNGNDNDTDMDVDSNEIADTKQADTKSESKGKKLIGDVIQASEVHVSSHHSLRENDGGPTKEVSNYKLDFDAEGDMHRESKSLRHFRAALIDFVKELVRPSWRDGKLSKDAHKMIVKKAVDKVLTSLPPEHIPNIQESIDTYLTSSQPKLTKLVEGYIEKYGKL
ncbi:hypothetical protein L1987_58839 [Smallanthus sonchifolius]|uniref:Uncharacterized protein n=1 Tax=Smallanthus sonchifolius TaxID=185202 RepID=A0ACB9D3K2_9ASTR|nr:hypothetical protein L1987_58839 [Smallanthus sonchifolius]